MSRFWSLFRVSTLFLVGMVVGAIGIVVAWERTVPLSAAQVKSTLLAFEGKGKSVVATACIPGKKGSQIYFVSCGGFF